MRERERKKENEFCINYIVHLLSKCLKKKDLNGARHCEQISQFLKRYIGQTEIEKLNVSTSIVDKIDWFYFVQQKLIHQNGLTSVVAAWMIAITFRFGNFITFI